MSEQINQIIKELDVLYKKAKTEEEYTETIKKGQELRLEAGKLCAGPEYYEKLANGLNLDWAKYYLALKFYKEDDAKQAAAKYILKDIETIYKNIADPKKKAGILYLKTVVLAKLLKDVNSAKLSSAILRELVLAAKLPLDYVLESINVFGVIAMEDKNWPKAVEIFSEINNFSMEELSTIENPDSAANIFSNLGASYVRGDINVTEGRENLLKAESYYLKAVTPSEKHLQGIKNRLREVEEKKSQLIVKKIIEDLSGRSGWDYIWGDIEQEFKEEIIEKWESIVQEGNNPYYIVKRIFNDLTDRRGLRQEWEAMDEEIQKEIKETWAEIVSEKFKEN